jgi:hypothetical protein
MKKLTIVSKTHGTHDVLLDDADYKKIQSELGTWYISLKRENFYVQKHTQSGVIEIQRHLMNPPKGLYVDHINRNPLDNRRKNLRICTNAANLRNGRTRSTNKSGHSGVCWDKERNKWATEIKVNYKKIFLGRYSNIKDAIRVRKLAEERYWSV